MRTYTPFQYLLIDAANQFGLDKLLFDQRIEWAMANFANLENMDCGEKTQPQFLKAVMAIRSAQRGEPIGHLVGLDACCSGMQIMSALTGCLSGAKATNLVNTGVRQDAYTLVTDAASSALGHSVGTISRKAIKQATMTHLYGSKAEPRKLFGEDTEELAAFYEGIEEVCPLANELLGDLIHTWNAYAEEHSWVLPDNFHAKVKVVDKMTSRVEIDEMDHATFEYVYKVICGKEHDVKNAANIIHSIDAYVLRCMERRCNYDYAVVSRAMEFIKDALHHAEYFDDERVEADGMMAVYIDLFERMNMPDVVILPLITSKEHAMMLSVDHLEALHDICEMMLSHKPFEILTIHDEFKAHCNNINDMRRHYIEVFANLADSNIIQDIIYQLTGRHAVYNRGIHNLSELIRESEYALS